mmetsp:Transcript_75234/g.232635  ORF Transcript_75234/g.232635 Transcript_75234/m.232635 type:complete len:204 (-) Transcript_75234:4-615(-)
MAPASEDEEEDDDDDETNALLAEIGAEASSLNRWCKNVRSSEAAEPGGHAPSVVGRALMPGGMDEELGGAADGTALLHPGHDPWPSADIGGEGSRSRIDTASSNTLGTPAATKASSAEALAWAFGPLRYLAWGVGFAVLMTLLAVVTTSTAGLASKATGEPPELPGVVPPVVEGPEADGAADGAMDLASRPLGRARGRGPRGG